MAKELNIKTIVEFVHNEEVYQKAKSLDVFGFQGHFLGKPVKNINFN